MEYIDQEQVSDICVLSPRKISCNKMEEHLNTLVDLRWKNNWAINEYLNSPGFRKDWEDFCILHNLQSVKWECSVENIEASLRITNWYKSLSKNILSMIKAIKKANEFALKRKNNRDNYHIKLSKDFLNYVKTWNGSFSLDLVYSSIVWWSINIWKMNWDLLINLLRKSNLEDRNNLVSIYEKIDSKPKNLSFKLLKIIIKMWYIDNISKFFKYFNINEIIEKLGSTILDNWSEKSLNVLFSIEDDFYNYFEYNFFESLIKKWYWNTLLNILEKIDVYTFNIIDILNLCNDLFNMLLKHWTEEDQERIIDIFIEKKINLSGFGWDDNISVFKFNVILSMLNLWKISYLIWEITKNWIEDIDSFSLESILVFDENLQFTQELLFLYKWLNLRKRWKARKLWTLLKEYSKTQGDIKKTNYS